MKTMWKFLSLAVALFVALPVSAQEILDVRVVDDANDFVLAFTANGDVGAPTVRASAGQVKVWFENAVEQGVIKQRLRTAPLGNVEIRGGSHDTAAVKIRFEERVELANADVRVDTKGSVATLRIARSLFPSLSPPAPAPAPVAKVEKRPEAPAPAPVLAKSAQPPAPAPVVADVPRPVVQTAVSEKAKPMPASFAPTGDSSLPMLAAISALLALVYGVMRWLMRKGKGAMPSPIEIVAQKRLGPRHQLLIVRAFGRDHLLSVQGANTTRIASARAGQMMSSDNTIAAAALDYEPDATAAREQTGMFGAALLRHALDERLREAAGESKGDQEPGSVSGLLRLRREAGL